MPFLLASSTRLRYTDDSWEANATNLFTWLNTRELHAFAASERGKESFSDMTWTSTPASEHFFKSN
eukprot:CAMPEP_0204015566 /NCGR_PEP_ID=MMETSP0360-20130528/26158_1 /ASSEMBLY_ACC=CAM_ASM_000342 /TAXON_ID=268821 /ORGANISM="Scrippsiella Hangoei, Strain SHTV-5" /LENGTH=65 /DNA_ID=CAMNT_0050958499 /DNA_START=134 /DNA_END=331 /DNA_ORIENTATION=+